MRPILTALVGNRFFNSVGQHSSGTPANRLRPSYGPKSTDGEWPNAFHETYIRAGSGEHELREESEGNKKLEGGRSQGAKGVFVRSDVQILRNEPAL